VIFCVERTWRQDKVGGQVGQVEFTFIVPTNEKHKIHLLIIKGLQKPNHENQPFLADACESQVKSYGSHASFNRRLTFKASMQVKAWA
jgi:hypothetical protein